MTLTRIFSIITGIGYNPRVARADMPEAKAMRSASARLKEASDCAVAAVREMQPDLDRLAESLNDGKRYR